MQTTYQIAYQKPTDYLIEQFPKVVKETLASGQYGADGFVKYAHDICSGRQFDPKAEVVFKNIAEAEEAAHFVTVLHKATKTIAARKFSLTTLLNDKRNITKDGKLRYETTPRLFPNVLAGYAQDDLQKLIGSQEGFLKKLQPQFV